MKSQPPLGHIIGFDFGEKRIGTAIADMETSHAQPLETIANRNNIPDWIPLDKLIETWQPVLFVIGKAGKTDSDLRRQSIKFAAMLKERYALPVDFAEEGYSSVEAEHRLELAKSAGLIKRISKKELDSVAATLILETWLLCNHESDTASADKTD